MKPFFLHTVGQVQPSCFVANSNITIKLEKRLTISHCTYCICQNSSINNVTNEIPQIDCYKTQDHQTFQEICKNCTILPSPNCSYCLQPNNRSLTKVIPQGQIISTKQDNCVACTCNDGGIITCNNLDISITAPVCLGLNQCEKKINELSKNSCQYCEDPITRLMKRSPSQWTKDPGITCNCFKGKVSCIHFAFIDKTSFSFMIYCEENCTTDKYILLFQERGKLFSFQV